MKYRDLREFVAQLESGGELIRVSDPVSPKLEMTALADQVLRRGGPALLFQNVPGYGMPVLTNLFGTPRRVALGMGADAVADLRQVGQVLATLKEPEPPRGLKDGGRLLAMAKALWDMKPTRRRSGPVQEVVLQGSEVDLTRWPLQTCWPGDVGPLLTWGLVITRGPQGVKDARKRQNLGIYRQQLIGRRELIMRWLAHRGGALDFRAFAAGQPGPALPHCRGAGRRPGHHAGRGDAGARQLVGIPVRRPAARQPDRTGGHPGGRGRCLAAGPGHRRSGAGRPHTDRGTGLRRPQRGGHSGEGNSRSPARPGGPVRRPHRLLQRAGLVPGVPGRPHHPPPRPDLPLHLHRQAAGRTRHAWAWR